MARAPIDYTLNVINPLQAAMQGYSFGLKEVQAKKDEERNLELFGMKKQEADDKRAAAQIASARKKEFYADFSRLVDGTMSRKDLLAKYPDFASTMVSTFDLIPDEVAAANIRTGLRIQNAMNNDRVDIALTLIDEQYTAAKNTPGQENEALQLEEMKRQIDERPRMVFEGIGLGITVSGGEGLEWRGQEDLPAGVSPLGKIAEDVRNKLLPQSVLDSAIETENAKTEDEGLTFSQKIQEEARLRGEYVKRTEDLTSAERNMSIIQTSTDDNSGAGDIALVTSFMKMLDPGSVVRETEFANAANAGGTLAQLKAQLTKVKNGQFLTETQRADFKRLAGQYVQAAKKQESGVRAGYQTIVDNYGLNPANVFGTPAAADKTTAPGIRGGQFVTIDFSSMGKNDIVMVDVKSLSPEQTLAMAARMRELE